MATENKHDMIEEEDEQDENDEMQIFDILSQSVDALKERYILFIEKPTIENHKEFDDLIKEYINLIRDIKNMVKGVLSQNEVKQPKKRIERSTEKKQDDTTTDIPQLIRQSAQDQTSEVKKTRGRKPKNKALDVPNNSMTITA